MTFTFFVPIDGGSVSWHSIRRCCPGISRKHVISSGVILTLPERIFTRNSSPMITDCEYLYTSSIVISTIEIENYCHYYFYYCEASRALSPCPCLSELHIIFNCLRYIASRKHAVVR